MIDIYSKLPAFLRKYLFGARHELERGALEELSAGTVANVELVDLLFKWHGEQFARHRAYETAAAQRDLEPWEMEQDNLAVSAMGFLEDAAAFVSARETSTTLISTLRGYLRAKLVLGTDILEGEVPHFALGRIIAKLQRLEKPTASLS